MARSIASASWMQRVASFSETPWSRCMNRSPRSLQPDAFLRRRGCISRDYLRHSLCQSANSKAPSLRWRNAMALMSLPYHKINCLSLSVKLDEASESMLQTATMTHNQCFGPDAPRGALKTQTLGRAIWQKSGNPSFLFGPGARMNFSSSRDHG